MGNKGIGENIIGVWKNEFGIHFRKFGFFRGWKMYKIF
jgi:hypothetical protein